MDGGAPDHLSFKQHGPSPCPIRSIPMLVGVGIEVELHPRACTHHLSVTLVVEISSRRSPHRRFQAGAVEFDEDLTRGHACCGIDVALGILCEGPGERHGGFATGGILDLVTTSVLTLLEGFDVVNLVDGLGHGDKRETNLCGDA